MRKILMVGMLAVFVVFLVGISAAQDADAASLEADLSGANEVLPNNSTATGEATATLDGNQLTVEGSFDGLSSELVTGVSAHIHENVPGENGPIVFDLVVDADDDNRSGTFSLTTTLGDNQVQDLITEQYYINIHTTAFPNGEIRGQLMVETNITDEDEDEEDESNQTINQTVNQTAANQTNVTTQANATSGISADLHIMKWYPKGPDYVFVCNITGFEPTSYTWFYGDGHKLLNIHNQNTYHVYEATGHYTVSCSGTDGTNTASDTLEIDVTNLTRPLHPLFQTVTLVRCINETVQVEVNQTASTANQTVENNQTVETNQTGTNETNTTA